MSKTRTADLRRACSGEGRALINWAVANGWAITLTKGCHLKFTHPIAGTAIGSATSRTGRHADYALLRRLMRAANLKPTES